MTRQTRQTRERNALILRVLTLCREASAFKAPLPVSCLIMRASTSSNLLLARAVVAQLCRAGALIAGADSCLITTIGIGLERTLASNPGALEVDLQAELSEMEVTSSSN
jgi:hypothetical protein